jgi:hypothetical protein
MALLEEFRSKLERKRKKILMASATPLETLATSSIVSAGRDTN